MEGHLWIWGHSLRRPKSHVLHQKIPSWRILSRFRGCDASHSRDLPMYCTSRKARRCFGPRLRNMLPSAQQFAFLGGIWSLARITLLVGTPILASSWHVINNSLLTDDISSWVLPGKTVTSIYEYWTVYAMLTLLYLRSKNPWAYLCAYFIVIW